MARERHVPGARARVPGPFQPADGEHAPPPARRVILLGPQRLLPTLNRAVEALGVRGRIAAVTAGWEEREGEDRELSEHLSGRTFNLRIWERGEEVYADDVELHKAVRARNERLGVMQELYRLRLAHMLEAAREILRRTPPPDMEDVYASEIEGMLANLRSIDREHLARIRALHVEFQERWTPWLRPKIARHRAELAELLAGAELLCIAGGHVAVLLRRLRLFGVLEMLEQQPIIAWSAGAMVVSERVVLFNDDPPQGGGSAEVFDVGLAACKGIIPLPHADQRLRLEDRERVAIFARRFAPDLCVALRPRARVDWDGERWHGASGTQRLDKSGALTQVRA